MPRSLTMLALAAPALLGSVALGAAAHGAPAAAEAATHAADASQVATHAAPHGSGNIDYIAALFVFMLASFIGVGVIRRVSRLLHTPLMSLTNAISAIAVVGSIMIAGGEQYSTGIRAMGAVALFCSMTNIVSGFLITNRMLKMFKAEAHK